MNNNNNSTSSSLSRSLLDSDLDPYSPGYHNNNNNNNNNNNSQQQQQQQQPNQPPQLQQQQQQQQSIPIPPQHHGANHQQSIEEMFDKIDLFGDIGGGSGLDTPKQQQQSTSQSSKTINNNNLLDLSGFEQILSINNNSNNNNNNRNNRNDEKDEEIRFKEKIFNSNRLDSLIEQLKETTLIHGEIQSEKAINENNIRSLYRQLWIVADDVQTLSETCPCGSTVNHVVKNQVSRLNIDIAKQLETLLTQNHHYNTSQFVGSLFSQSLNELRVLIYLYRFVCRDLENSNNNNNNDLIDDLSDASDTDTSATSAAKLLNTETIILDKLVTAYSSSDNTTVPSPPILSLLCQLTLKLKSKLDTYSISASKQQQSSSTHGLDGSGNLIDTIDFEDDILTSTTTPQSLLQQESVKRYNKIIADVTFNFKQEFVAWGYILIQPTIEDVFQRDWLLKLFHIPDVLAANQAGVTPNIKYLSEQSYINLVSQLDFKNRFARLTTYQNLNVHDKILYPLQKALELSISLKMMQLSQTICKILALISFYFEDESEKCLGILFKSVWPSQLLSCTVMPMFNWKVISLESLPLVFMDVYQITLPPQEYLRLSDSAKQPIRYQFFHTLISYQYIINQVYAFDNTVQSFNSNSRFPQLQLLRRLAQKSVADENTMFELLNDGGTTCHLSRIIFDELFYLAFIFKMPNMMYQQGTFPTSLVQTLRSEIFSQLHILLQTHPFLANRFMYNVAQSMVSIDVESVTIFLDPQGSKSPLYFWDLTGDGLNWLIFIVSQRLLPTNIPDYQILDQPRSFVQQFVIDPPPYEITQQHANIASAIASRVLMSIHWAKATPVGRYKTILMLLGGRKVLGKWMPTFVNHSRLFTNPDAGSILRPQLIEIQEINPRAHMYFSQDGGLLLYLQLLCFINMAVVDVPEMSTNDIQYNLINRVKQFVYGSFLPMMGGGNGGIVLNTNNTVQFEILASTLTMVMYLVKDHLNQPILNDLSELYHQITQRKQQFSPNLNILLLFIKPWFSNTIDCYSNLLNSWIKLLKVNLFDEENLTILNYLACGSYLKNYGNEMIRELESSSVSNHDIKAMTKSLERRPWICYMILMAHIHTQKKSMSQPKLKDCLVLIKEMAIDLKTNAISLIFWEQFWVLYFELLMTNQTDPMSQDTKNNLYSTISLYMNKYPMTPPIKKIFETFTTWNKHTILSYNGEKFITPSNEELYKIFITNALWVFAKNEDKLNQERNQKHWLSGFSKIIDPKVLCDQLPMIKPATASDFSLEVKKYKNFIEILTTTSKNLSNGHRHSNSGEFEGIRLFNDLKLYIGHSKRLSNDILNDDKVFLDLSQNLHTTTTSKQNVLLRCTNVCIGVTSQYDQKISKPNTHIQMEIQENRKKFNQNFYSLFERIYQLSLLACVVEDEHLLTMFKGREIDLFKHLVDLVQDNHTDSIVSKLICTIREIAIDIGREILTKDPSNQQFLVDYFFKKDPKNGTTSGDFSIFISLFSPSNITNINTYLDVLEDCVRFNGISNKEKREIIDLFKLENRIQQLFTCPSGKDRLVNLLPYFITLPMMESTIVLINSLLFIDSSHLINITLMMVKYKASFELMEKVFGKSKPFYEFLKSLGHSDQQNLIIQTIIELMTDTKSVSALFLLGNIISYDFLNRPFLQSLLTKIRLIYIQAIRPIDNATSPSQHSQPYVLNNTEFKLSLDFFVDLTLLIPRAVNMLWEVFYYGYMPLLDQMETHGSSGVADRHTQELVELIGNLAIGGHMNVATFHIQSADVLEQMCHVICQTIYSDIVVAIFSIVDWNLLFSMEKIPDVVALHYLKLSIYMSIMNGRSVSAPETGLALASEGVSLDWYKCGDLSEASVVFDGSTFTSIIASPTLKLNPSQSIVEALTLFKEITLYLDNYSLAIALTLEIRSLLYFIAQSFDHSSYWYLPFVDQLNLVQNLLLPLIRSLAENKAAKDQEQSGIQQRMKSILKITMSCLEFSQHLPKTDCPLFYGSLTTVDEQGHLDSYNKIQRIMMAFCSSLSMNLCLQIMPIAHIVLHGTNYCQVMESVLHSFFTDDTIPVSTLINKYLVFTDPHLIIEKSIQNGCPLLLYIVVLQQIKTNTFDVNYFLDHICSIPCGSNREYELWVIWILIIKLIRTNSINLKNNKQIGQKINTIKSWIQSYFGNSNPLTSLFSKNKAVLPQTHLASRACCVFLQRSILQQIGKSKEDESLLNTTSDSLMEMKKKSSPTFSSGAGGGSATQYHAFNQFFEQAENFLSPIVEIDDFSQILVQTLIPFASYLLNLLKYDP